MLAKLRILGLVPARGKSKGVPRKNLCRLGNRSLLEWTAEAAYAAQCLDRVVLSTDDLEIAAEGKRVGLDVPFLRPDILAEDDTPTLPVIRHALASLAEQNDHYDAVALLQPTSPFRPPGLIDAAAALLVEKDATSVITVKLVPHTFNPHWVFCAAADGRLALATGEAEPIPRRQSLPPAYVRDGSLYLTLTQTLMLQNSLYGPRCYPLCWSEGPTVNLDSPEDFVVAAKLLEQRTHPISASV